MKLTIAEAWPLLKEGMKIRTNAHRREEGQSFEGEVMKVEKHLLQYSFNGNLRYIHPELLTGDNYIENL